MGTMELAIGTECEYNRVSWVINKLQEIPEGQLLLDACADGSRYKRYCAHLNYVSQDFCKYSNNYNQGMQTEARDTTHIDITAIPVPDNSFDAILCSEVFEHIKDPKMAIKEFSRILKRNGVLILTAPFCSLTHMAPYHYSTGFNIYWYRSILREFGFQITEETINGDYFSYLAQGIRRIADIVTKHTNYQISENDIVLLDNMLDLLEKMQHSDNNSSEILCYGYGIVAKKHIDDVTVIITCTNYFHNIFGILEYLLYFVSQASGLKIIIVNSCNESGIAEQLSCFENKSPNDILIINIDESYSESDYKEIALSYANSYCHLYIDKDIDVYKPDLFNELQPDPVICDIDRLKYLKDKYRYISMSFGQHSFLFNSANEFPKIQDYREMAGSVDGHYFFQDIYVANKIHASKIEHVYDIGSRVDGYISHLLSMDIKVTMIDIRPFPIKINNLNFIKGDATDLTNIPTSSIHTLSCLHALEHFGLGRYGDPVDPDGWRKALIAFKRIIALNGTLYLSVPVGVPETVMFNAHRIFDPFTIISGLYPTLRIKEFALIHDCQLYVFKFEDTASINTINDTIDNIRLKYMGSYDCGIFTFVKS